MDIDFGIGLSPIYTQPTYANAALSSSNDRNTCVMITNYIYIGGDSAVIPSCCEYGMGVGEDLADIGKWRAYRYLDLYDYGDKDEFLEVIPKIISFIDRVRSEDGVIYLHCAYGQSRSPHAGLAYMVREGYSIDEGWKRIQSVRPRVAICDGYICAIKEYFHS
jgi:hypothetical protein